MHILSSRLLRLPTRLTALPLAAALALATFWPAAAVRAEGLPKASVVATNPETGEVDRGPGVFTISLSEKVTKPVTVNYALKGSAVNGENYNRLPGFKVIKAGKKSANINVVYSGPLGTYFQPETVKIEILPGKGYQVGLTKRATVTIEFVLP